MSRDEAFAKAQSLWGSGACIHEETRRNDEGTSTLYSVGHGGDLFNWTALGRGWSYEAAFAEAGVTFPAQRTKRLAAVPTPALTPQESHPL